MADHQPTKSDVEEEMQRLRGAVAEYPALRPIVDNLPREAPDPASGAPDDTPTTEQPEASLGFGEAANVMRAVPDVTIRMAFNDFTALNRWRVSLAEKSEALDARQEMYQNRARALNVQLKQGKIQPDEWFRRMRGEIRKLHLSAYGIGYSGKFDRLSQRDYGQVGAAVQKQYRYLQRWKQQIRAEGIEEQSLAQLNDRAQKYGAAARESFEKGYTAEVGMPSGILPAYPGDGQSICLTRCRCRWAIDILDKQNQDFNCTWTLGVAEHCETCLNRSMEWVQLEVRNGVLESSYEPIFA